MARTAPGVGGIDVINLRTPGIVARRIEIGTWLMGAADHEAELHDPVDPIRMCCGTAQGEASAERGRHDVSSRCLQRIEHVDDQRVGVLEEAVDRVDVAPVRREGPAAGTIEQHAAKPVEVRDRGAQFAPLAEPPCTNTTSGPSPNS